MKQGQAYDRALEIDPKLFERQASGGFGTLIQMSQQKDMMAQLCHGHDICR